MRTEEVSELLIDVAARVVLPRWRRLGADDVFDKGHGDLVTVADREAERELGAALAAATPGALIVGEEAVAEGVTNLADLAGAGHAWLIDPVDGTGNFAHGSPDFAVMVAEVVGGATERAWIWQPVHERLYVAERGRGASRNGEPIPPRPRPGVPVGTVPGSRRARVAEQLRVVPSWRCCGMEYPALLEGDRDFLVYRTVKPWDHLPGALLVAEVGGRVATLEGADYRAGVDGSLLVVAASAELWGRVAGALG